MSGREALSVAYHVLTGNDVFTPEQKVEAAKKLSVFPNWKLEFPIPVEDLRKAIA